MTLIASMTWPQGTIGISDVLLTAKRQYGPPVRVPFVGPDVDLSTRSVIGLCQKSVPIGDYVLFQWSGRKYLAKALHKKMLELDQGDPAAFRDRARSILHEYRDEEISVILNIHHRELREILCLNCHHHEEHGFCIAVAGSGAPQFWDAYANTIGFGFGPERALGICVGIISSDFLADKNLVDGFGGWHEIFRFHSDTGWRRANWLASATLVLEDMTFHDPKWQFLSFTDGANSRFVTAFGKNPPGERCVIYTATPLAAKVGQFNEAQLPNFKINEDLGIEVFYRAKLEDQMLHPLPLSEALPVFFFYPNGHPISRVEYQNGLFHFLSKHSYQPEINAYFSHRVVQLSQAWALNHQH